MSESMLEPRPTRPAKATPGLSAVPDDLIGSPVEAALAMVGPELVQVEQELHELVSSRVDVIPRLAGHLAFAGGKRFRPMLTLLSARAAGFTEPVRFTVAAVGELLHTATLLHDDVIDEGAFRRGRPAARIEYGNGRAVLTGDYCLARAVQAIAHLGHVEANRSMADAVTAMAEGEVAQLDVAGECDLDRDTYYDVINRKTAALIAWCASVASLPSKEHSAALFRYGREVGYAFQISDDIIDCTVDVGHSGKERGQDLRDGKMTLPLIIACERDEPLRARVRRLMAAGPPIAPADVRPVLDAVVRCGAVDEAIAIAEAHAKNAIEQLAPLPQNAARDSLAALAHYVAHRTR